MDDAINSDGPYNRRASNNPLMSEIIACGPNRAATAGEGHRSIMKKVVSGGPVPVFAFPQAEAGLPDTIPLN